MQGTEGMVADRYIGAGFFVLGAVMAWASSRIAYPMLGQGDPGPQVLPFALGVLIAILGAGLCLRQPGAAIAGRAVTDEADTATVIPAEPPILRVAHAANLVAYALLFERLGFSVATFAFLSIAIFLLGQRNVRGALWAVLTAAIVTLVVGSGLKTGVGVQLPGVLFG